MSETTDVTPDDLTLVRGAIHREDEPRHFMRLKPVAARVRVRRGNAVLAETTDALRCLEAGRDLYDPVLYLPRADVAAPLERAAKRSHCPLKGDATHFDLGGEAPEPEVAWSYEAPLPDASALAGRVAFDAARVAIEEVGPREAGG